MERREDSKSIEQENAEERMRQLRKQIKEIQSNPSLSAIEKAKMIQRLMSGKPLEEDKPAEPTKVPDELNKTITYNNKEKGILGCKHYQTNCKICAACCGELFTCRFCHDENVQDHPINRYATKEVMCMFCQFLQPVGQTCANPECGKTLAHYYCDICKFHDNDPKKTIFHCKECGLCRIGPTSKFFHCNGCGICLSMELQGKHTCIPNNMHANCPICHTDLFSSRRAGCLMKCGHSIHNRCLTNYLRSGAFTCPLCSKSIIDMQQQWQMMDSLIQQQPMPSEFANAQCNILCNDCNQKSDAPFHFLGLKCSHCGGYNTVINSRSGFPETVPPPNQQPPPPPPAADNTKNQQQ